MAVAEKFEFGQFVLDVAGMELRQKTAGTAALQVSMRPQAFHLLVYLVRNRDRAVTKEELWEKLPKRPRSRRRASRFTQHEPVFDVNVVDQALLDLRRAFGGPDASAAYIFSPSPGTLRFIGSLANSSQSDATKQQTSRVSETRSEISDSGELLDRSLKSATPDIMVVDLGGGVSLELVKINAGSFLMGSPEYDGFDAEKPLHVVSLDSFLLGRYPITQSQWRLIMGTNPSHVNDEDLPVERVAWPDASEFCKKLSERTGHRYCLPTEAEWEYACRGGTTTRFCHGDDESLLNEYAWFKDNSHGQTHDPGQKRSNDWGLSDMHGNVWEWCSDLYNDSYYGLSPSLNPVGPETGKSRVMRGGSWSSNYMNCRSAARNFNSPGARLRNVGLRVARK